MNNFEDELYVAAVKVCRDAGRISTSQIQRALRIGYVKASLIVEAMGERGIAERVDPDGTWVFIDDRKAAAMVKAFKPLADARKGKPPREVSLKELVASALRGIGAEGLCEPDAECGCGLDDFMPCGQPAIECVAAKRGEIIDGFPMMTPMKIMAEIEGA